MSDDERQPDLFPADERRRVERERARREDPLKQAVCALCRLNPVAYGGWARVEKEIRPLRKVGATPEAIVRFGEWYAHVFWGDWRQYPKVIPTILKHWGQYEEWERGESPADRAPTDAEDLTSEQINHLTKRYIKGD